MTVFPTAGVPFYYAGGTQGNLLMCHEIIDVNVYFQDTVPLTQHMIEPGKENWKLAVYQLEDQALNEPSSWTNEDKRILNLLERMFKK